MIEEKTPYGTELGTSKPGVGHKLLTKTDEHKTRANWILKVRSKHKVARKVLIEISCRLCLENKTLRELGKDIGGISGVVIARVHERLKEKIRKDKSLDEEITRLTESFCQ